MLPWNLDPQEKDLTCNIPRLFPSLELVLRPQLTPSGMSAPSSPLQGCWSNGKSHWLSSALHVLSVTLGNCFKPRFSPIKLGEVSKMLWVVQNVFLCQLLEKSTTQLLHTRVAVNSILPRGWELVDTKTSVKKIEAHVVCSQHNTGGM